MTQKFWLDRNFKLVLKQSFIYSLLMAIKTNLRKLHQMDKIAYVSERYLWHVLAIILKWCSERKTRL